jgi:hypothetical protein
MGQASDGALPQDIAGYRADGVYVPGVGTVALQGASMGTDTQGTNYAQGVFTANGYNYTNITTKTTTTAKTGSGVLHGIVINKAGSADTLTVYDNTAGSGTTIGTITVTSSVNFVFLYDVAFSTGLTVVSGGTTAGDYTVIWR